jgi:hypothetical protein
VQWIPPRCGGVPLQEHVNVSWIRILNLCANTVYTGRQWQETRRWLFVGLVLARELQILDRHQKLLKLNFFVCCQRAPCPCPRARQAAYNEPTEALVFGGFHRAGQGAPGSLMLLAKHRHSAPPPMLKPASRRGWSHVSPVDCL